MSHTSNSRSILLRHPQTFFLDGYEIACNEMVSVAISDNASDKFKEYISAAMLAYFGRYSSIDYVRKKYALDYFKKSTINNRILLGQEINNIIRKYYTAILTWAHTPTDIDLPDKFGLVAAGAALTRLTTSFRTCCFLLKQGFHFEAHCICKLILEQTAWAFKVHQIEDESLYGIAPSKSINSLKKFFPDIGNLYGKINEAAHINTSKIHQLVSFEKGKLEIILAEIEPSLHTALLLLKLTDIYGVVTELIYQPYSTNFNFITRQDDTYIPDKNREILKEYIHLSSLVQRIA